MSDAVPFTSPISHGLSDAGKRTPRQAGRNLQIPSIRRRGIFIQQPKVADMFVRRSWAFASVRNEGWTWTFVPNQFRVFASARSPTITGNYGTYRRSRAEVPISGIPQAWHNKSEVVELRIDCSSKDFHIGMV